jgi:hypothetical protein
MPGYLSDFIGDELADITNITNQQKIGIAGFSTMATVRKGSFKKATMPEVYMEDGSYTTDQVINSPRVIEIEGTVGGTHIRESALQKIYFKDLAAVGSVSTYAQNYTRQQLLAINSVITDAANVVNKIDGYLDAGEQVYDLFNSENTAKPIAQQFEELMEALMDNGVPIKVEMPNRVFSNMVILGFQATYPVELVDTLEFQITVGKLRFAKTVYEDISKYYQNPAPAVKTQAGENVSKGINKTKPVETSALFSIVNPSPEALGNQ